jgi:mRNA interferase YafQ
MREIRRSTAFRRDYKRERAGRHGRQLDALLTEIVSCLAADVPLPAANRDHLLGGDWFGYRDCHLKPDLLLIYRKPDPDTLDLARLGSHSELFG